MRNDIHRPSEIKVDDYEYVGVEYMKIETIGDVYILSDMRTRIKEHMKITGGTYSKHQHGGNCHICGAHCIYTLLFYHEKTNTYIRTGSICAEKLEMALNSGEFEAFKTSVKRALELKAGKKKAQKILEVENLNRAWEIYNNVADNEYEEHRTLRDIVGKLIRYGNVSENQVKYLRILVDNIDNNNTIEQRRQRERETAKDCPTGATLIKGKVVKIQYKAGYYGGADIKKIIVKTLDGYVVWGTCPRSIIDVEKGDSIELVGNVTPSQYDSKFGFFKRPKNAKRIII